MALVQLCFGLNLKVGVRRGVMVVLDHCSVLFPILGPAKVWFGPWHELEWPQNFFNFLWILMALQEARDHQRAVVL